MGALGKAIGVLEKAVARGIPTIPADRAEPAYEGEFVHIQGDLDVGDLTDPLTGFTIQGTQLIRHLEMLQWEEERYRVKGMTNWSFRWNKFWSNRLIDSDSFNRVDVYFEENRDNPKEFPYENGQNFFASYLNLAAQTIAVLGDGRAPQKNWIGYVFVGLLLCIGIIARAFPFLKGFTEAPFPKRAIITVVVAAIGTAIAGVLA